MRLSKSNKKDLKEKETTTFTGLGNDNNQEENSIAGMSSKNKKSFQ